MFGLEQYADAFDRMHESVQHDFDGWLDDGGREAGRKWGAESGRTYAMAVCAGGAWALGTFVLGSGKSLVDTLRLGEGVKKGTAWGFAEDGLRVLNLAPAVGSGAKVASRGLGWVGRTASLRSMAGVVGQQGAASCGPTAIAAASRLSGRAFAITLDEVGQATGKALHPNNPAFPGLWNQELKTTLAAVGATAQEVDVTAGGLQQVEQLASQGRGPVIFGAQWWGGSGVAGLNNLQVPVGNAAHAAQYAGEADHWMVAFRNAAGRVMVADQYGIRAIKDAGTIGGSASPFTVRGAAMLVEDGAVMKSLATIERGGPAVASAMAGDNARSVISAGVAVNMVMMNAQTTWAVDTAIRDRLGRDARPWPGMSRDTVDAVLASAETLIGGDGRQSKDGSSNIGAPGFDPLSKLGPRAQAAAVPQVNVLSPTLQEDQRAVLARLPLDGAEVEFGALVQQTRLGDARVRNAILGLSAAGMARVARWTGIGANAVPVFVARTFGVRR